MTSLIKYGILIGILFLIIGTSPLQGTDQSINNSTPKLNRIWTQSHEDQPDTWWVFVELQIDSYYWQNLDSFLFTITIQDINVELIPNPGTNNDNSEIKQFIGIISYVPAGYYYVSIEWKDGSTSKVWTNEKLHVGSTSYIDKFHFIAPVVILGTILTLGVIFPGKIKSNSQTKSYQELEEI